jgi:peptidyl-prolyl cis-trans isomerase SurA
VFKSIKTILPILIVFSCLFALACGDNRPSGGDGEVVAKVGSKEITLKQVDTVIKQQLDQSPGATFSPAELAAARMSVLDNLIREEAFFQKAQKENLVPDDNKVTQELQKKKQEAGLTEEQYQAQLKQAGLSEDEYKDKIRHDLAIAALQDKEKTRVNPPSEDEVKKYYEDHPAEFKVARGVDLSLISVSPANNGGDAGAETKIKAIYAQLKSGSDFATLAAQRSEDPSNIRGGNVGFLSEDQLKQGFPSRPEIVQRLMTSMNAGEYTEPLKDNLAGSWAIFKLNDRREKEEDLSFENPNVRKSIVDAITQQRQQVLMNALLLVSLSESNPKNYLAQRIVEDPKRIVEMKPSALLTQAAQQQPPKPRVENQNQSTPATTNANRPAADNANSAKPAAANSNK